MVYSNWRAEKHLVNKLFTKVWAGYMKSDKKYKKMQRSRVGNHRPLFLPIVRGGLNKPTVTRVGRVKGTNILN